MPAFAYWLAPERLLAGEYPGAREKETARAKLVELLDAGVTAFVDLTPEHEHGLLPYAALLQVEAERRGRLVSHQRFPLRDGTLPDQDAVRRILNALDAAVDTGEVVYLHGHGGVKREGMIGASWLVRHGVAPAEALNRVRPLPAPEQRAVVLRAAPAAPPRGPGHPTDASRISSFALNARDVPDPDGPLDAIWRFATTFPGDRWLRFEELRWLHRVVLERHVRSRALPHDLALDPLRALLYTESTQPVDERFARALVAAIRRRLEEDEWWMEQMPRPIERRARRIARSGESHAAREHLRRVLRVLNAAGEEVDALAPEGSDPLVMLEHDLACRTARGLLARTGTVPGALGEAHELAARFDP